MFYVAEQINAGRADWVDPEQPERGIICRELLYFGPHAVRVETVSVSESTLAPMPYVKFVLPAEEDRKRGARLAWQRGEREEENIFWQKPPEEIAAILNGATA